MGNKLEQLLNSLIKRGRVPFGYELLYPDVIEDCFDYDGRRKKCRFLIHKNFVDEVHNSLRELVSMESGLRQFVCKNDMVDKKKIGIFYEMFLEENGIDAKNYRPFSLVERLIIESALCDEDKLEEYLLSNIKIDG